MPKKRLGAEQVATMLRQVEVLQSQGKSVAAACKETGLTEQSYYRPRGILRCVDRCWPSAAQARRSEIDRDCRTCAMHARRRAGLSSFPVLPPSG
jgi:hypothetical protein